MAKKIKIDFSTNAQNGINCTKNLVNFQIKNKMLRNGMGVNNLSVCYNGTHTKTFVIRDDVARILDSYFYTYFNTVGVEYGIFLLCAQKTDDSIVLLSATFETSSSTFYEISGINFSSVPIMAPFTIGGLTYFLFVPTNFEDYSYLLTNNSSITIHNIPASNDVAFYDGKVYAITKANANKLFITSNESVDSLISSQFNGDIVDFSDGLGKFLALKQMNGYLYAIREKGITRIMSSGCGESFSYKTISFDFSKIFEGTICVCDDVMMMVGVDGVYVFDGIDFQKLSFDCNENLEDINRANCATYDGVNYYFSANLQDETKEHELPCVGLTHNSLVCVNTKTKEVLCTRGVSVSKLMSCFHNGITKVVICFDDVNQNKLGEINFDGQLFDSVSTKIWESYDACFDEKHVIKSIELCGNGQFEIKIFADDKKYVFNASLTSVPTKINTNLRGKKFELVLKSSSQDASAYDIFVEVL